MPSAINRLPCSRKTHTAPSFDPLSCHSHAVSRPQLVPSPAGLRPSPAAARPLAETACWSVASLANTSALKKKSACVNPFLRRFPNRNLESSRVACDTCHRVGKEARNVLAAGRETPATVPAACVPLTPRDFPARGPLPRRRRPGKAGPHH